MNILANWLTFSLVIVLGLSAFLDSLAPRSTFSNRAPASVFSPKSCKAIVLNFIDAHKDYNIPTYSVGTLTYKKQKQKYITEFKNKSAKQKLKSLKKLNEHRGSSTDLNRAYVDLLNDLLRKKHISKYNIRKLVAHTKEHSVELMFTSKGTVQIHPKGKAKLMGSEELLEKVLKNKEYDEQKYSKYSSWFSDITEEELMIIKKHFTDDHEEMKALRRYLSFSRTLPGHEKYIALEHAHEVYVEGNQRPWMKKFRKDRDRFNNFKDRHRKKYLKKHREVNDELRRQADDHAEGLARLYEKLYYGCRNTNSTNVQLQASKTYGKFILTLAPITAGTSYTVVNWDKEKDDKWFKGIAYDIVLATFLNFYAGKLLTGAGDSHLTKLVKSMSFYGGVDLLTAPAYNAIFSPSEEEREEKLRELIEDPNKRKELNEFLQFIYDSDIDPEFEKKLTSLVGKENGESVTLEDLQALDSEQIFSDEGTEVFLELYADKLYDDGKGEWIVSGNQGLDRFWFHRAWDVTSFPLDIYANMLIFDKLCATVNPKKAKLEAALLFLGWRAINDAGYYYFRGEAVNQ